MKTGLKKSTESPFARSSHFLDAEQDLTLRMGERAHPVSSI